MYLDHFGLRTDPFPLYPSLKFVFLSSPFEEAMAHLAYGLEQNEDIVLLSGPIGTGKTLAVQSLLANVGRRYQTAFVNVTQVDFSELLKLVLADLGAPVTGPVDRADLLSALKAQVQMAQARGQKILIVVDEAQNLAPDTLEGLRMLTNLGQPGGQVLQLVLTGQPDLERKVNLPELVQLRQRIRVHYCLETLSREEVAAYIAHRVKVAGCDRTLFRPKALDLIHRASSGVPRLVNILASRALLSAFVAGKKEVDVEHVDLDDLPPAAGVVPRQGAPAAKSAPVPDAKKAEEPTREAAPTPQVAPVPKVAPTPQVAPVPKVAPTPQIAPLPEVASVPERPASAAMPPPRPRPPTTFAAGGTPPFSPSTVFQRRNRRGRLFFLLALLVLAGGVLVVFGLKPDGVGRPAEAMRVVPSRVEPVAPPAAEARETTTPMPASVDSAVAPTAAVVAPAAGPDLPQAESPAVQVAVVSPPPVLPTAAAVGAAQGDSVFAVHVHSFQDMARANADIAVFQKAGYPVFFRNAEVDGRAWQRVYVGPFSSMVAAQEAAHRLHEQGVATYALIVRLGHGEP